MNSPFFNETAPDVFEYNAPCSALGMQIGHRMTVIKLRPESGGGLWIHSPVQMTDELVTAVEALAEPGTARHLIIPSRTHDLHLKEWMQRIPADTTFAPAAIGRVHPDWKIGGILTEDFTAPWSTELPHTRLLGAPRVNEVIFFHAPTKTLILVDSVFNLRTKQPLIGGLLLTLNKCRHGIATSRLFRSTIKDKSAFSASLKRVLEWDFERVLVGHGDLIEGSDVAALRAHLASFTEG